VLSTTDTLAPPRSERACRGMPADPAHRKFRAKRPTFSATTPSPQARALSHFAGTHDAGADLLLNDSRRCCGVHSSRVVTSSSPCAPSHVRSLMPLPRGTPGEYTSPAILESKSTARGTQLHERKHPAVQRCIVGRAASPRHGARFGTLHGQRRHETIDLATARGPRRPAASRPETPATSSSFYIVVIPRSSSPDALAAHGQP
jgi:hypothetical protein